MLRLAWLSFRGALFVVALGLVYLDGLSWVVLPGRVVLELLGAAGPQPGKHAVLLSAVFYAGAALVATLLRRQTLEGDVALDLTRDAVGR